jgi:alcohol dehydrogenase class IV
MAEAAHLAGKAINIAKTTAAHAVSYLLTVFHNIPHGHAVALTMAKFFIVNSKPEENVLNEQRGKSYLKKTINEISNLFGCASSQDFAEKWYKLMRDVGLETDFKTLGISKQSDIDRIIRNVNMERLDNNPARINEAILRQIFE